MKTFFTATIASVALAGIAAAGTVNFSNFGSTWEIQASGTPINGGFVSVGTTGVSDFSDAAAAQTALAADFTAFGASTDFGNVSQVVPAFALSFAVSEEPVPGHSVAMTKAATTDLAHANALGVAKTLALTACELLADPDLLKAARLEFTERVR